MKNLISITLFCLILLSGCQCKKQQTSVQQVQPKLMAEEKKIPAFKMNDINGKEVDIMSEIAKNKITIIDFWASWCRPCIQEAPNVVSIYNDLHSKGLGIIGISLDEDDNSWKKAVSKLNMNWTQLSNLKGGGSHAAQFFQINAIPHIVIVNDKGGILAEGLRGDELRSFVEQHLQ